MSSVSAAIRRFREQSDASALQHVIPFLQHMRIRFDIRSDAVVGTLPFSHDLIGNPTIPALHGGALAAFLEATAVATILWSTPEVLLPKVVNSTIDYLRMGRPEDTTARSSITKLGRRVVSVQTIGWQRDPERPITIVQSHFLLRPLPHGSEVMPPHLDAE